MLFRTLLLLIALALASRVLNAGRGTAPGAGSVNPSLEFGDLIAAAGRFKPRTFGVFLSHPALHGWAQRERHDAS
jgi:hypothetical protein